jgi:hypothetical protein
LLYPSIEGNRPEEELGMAKQMKLLPARKPRDRSRDDDSLLLRSAESLGRVIGVLQRQLDDATRRLSHSTGNGELSPAKKRPPSPKASARQALTATKRKSPASRKASAKQAKRR